MKLKDFIEKNCIVIKKWCVKNGLCVGTVYKMLRDENYLPDIRIAYRIIEATNGVVAFKDIYPERMPEVK